MESKFQKATIAHMESLISEVIRSVEHRNLDDDEYGDLRFELYRKVDEINKLINESGLDNKLFDNAIEKIYNSLMKTKQYDIAASLAKKYGL
ncbi:MAG: hypothetical protein COY75_02605 [Nitrospirae bacterium CG_4_10_14_0_8_um_filter_41_23]|nr:hypothetical protein [Nitrospirota bacterium]PIQ94774.1 MAG: hypothetical protein COV68_02775 [Nitrospirae bacterium CG11_big_fil_rev_8_21_14_0_20_41_14]PIY87450.1 MAG: hypothetical protein COY75_02605 [Nitrospirae bacterium CG_4_10_14_0_8_um_filter_41_23]